MDRRVSAADYGSQENAFQYLNRKFAGRGLAAQVKAAADSYGSEGMYDRRRSSAAPMTLGEFEQGYRRRTGYMGKARTVQLSENMRSESYERNSYEGRRELSAAGQPSRAGTAPQRGQPHMPNARAVHEDGRRQINVPKQRQMQSINIGRASSPQLGTAKKQTSKSVAPEARKPIASGVRRAVTKKRKNGSSVFESIGMGLRRLPMGAMMTVMVCAVSLMFVVGSSVLMSDASGEYVDMKDEISQLSKKESELLIALEVKNDLRAIEDIAVNQLGMVKKDLVTRQYIKLSEEDIIETYEAEENNVGLSTLLSAIVGKRK